MIRLNTSIKMIRLNTSIKCIQQNKLIYFVGLKMSSQGGIKTYNYDPKNLAVYLAYLLDQCCHLIIRDRILKYEIVHRQTTNSTLIFKFEYLYKKKVDINQKNNIIISKSRDITKVVQMYMLGRIYYGTEGSYRLSIPEGELLCKYPNEENIHICLNYERAPEGNIFTLLPKDLELTILDKLDRKKATLLISSGLTVLGEDDYRLHVSFYNKELYDDIIYIKDNFTGWEYTWADIYLNIKNYKDINSSDKGVDYKKVVLRGGSDEYTITRFDGIIMSIRLKNLFPQFFNDLLAFYKNYSNNLEDWMILMMTLIAIFSSERNTQFIDSVMNGFNSPVIFPSIADIIGYKHEIIEGLPTQQRLFYNRSEAIMKLSPYFLWYFMNLNNVTVSDDPFVWVNILNSLKEKFEPDIFVYRLPDDVLIKPPPLWPTAKRYKKLRGEMDKEKTLRGI